jgi:beta-glucosidase-like glycosyl hydrolase
VRDRARLFRETASRYRHSFDADQRSSRDDATEVERKQVDIAEIDQAVSRVLRAKFLAGLFDAKRSDGDPHGGNAESITGKKRFALTQ